ncbi:hypothetical protein CPB83DRAFT_918383 [Crepidotus variabilis]|uniref:TauD/TfdA-like domain-containing protein n=1 Tax=Crepidotus variabilis TaxID=179855 RepID=A0A9P6JIG4_9AGAR|nr:hypothetical protein CPB83DRAFT_918383 [Crepidotus variabilis]
MAPVAVDDLKKPAQVGISKPIAIAEGNYFNPAHYPPEDLEEDPNYKYNDYKPSFPAHVYEPLKEQLIVDRGLSADPKKANLLGAASKVTQLTSVIGTEILGIDLRQLTNAQKDELALLVAERGVVFFRDQEIDIHQQLELARHFGPLHKHATTPVPKVGGLEEVHVVYNDDKRRPDPSAFSKLELWHSDVSYELQPPSTTSLKVVTCPEVGGDTLWSSGYALYSSLSPSFQKYLESLYVVHSAAQQADGQKAAGLPIRRPPIETVHPLVRVHPVTGWKSVYVNPGFSRYIRDVPKVESDFVLNFLYRQISENPDFQVRFRWETNSVAFWDNRIVTHSATYDIWPATRHALRATPHGERPISVEEYERQTGKEAKDRQIEVWKQQGIKVTPKTIKSEKTRGYYD